MYYFTYEQLIGKYPDLAKNADANAIGSYWYPGVQAQIDGWMAGMYTCPFTPVPVLITDIAMDLCYYKLTYRQMKQDELLKNILRQIDDIGSRKTSLLNADGTQVNPFPQVSLTTSGYGSSFGMDDTFMHRVDSGWQQDNAQSQGWPDAGPYGGFSGPVG